ncbi:SDR family oxidoreductase [Candidatus Microgenomates bacterium]|nr:SDR family oxidoreductase [Candidatus Microgenomates bacterium]
MKQKIIGIGLSGMVGSRIVDLLKDQYQFENLSLETGVDIRDKEQVKEKISKSTAQIILHLAAKTDVDSCEKDKKEDIRILKYQDIKKKQEYFRTTNSAWAVNVIGTKNIVDACKKFDKRMIYISTDFVFDGKNPPTGGYTEKDSPHPINWYAQTKYEGEKIVRKSKSSYLILRIAFPFRAFFAQKKDFVRSILEKLKKGEKIKAFSDQIITPTFIDDIAYALNFLIQKNAIGVYHLVGSQSLIPYKAVCLIASQFNLDTKLVSCVRIDDYYKNKASRPRKLVLSNDKIKKIGVKMRSFEEGIREVKKQRLKFSISNF